MMKTANTQEQDRRKGEGCMTETFKQQQLLEKFLLSEDLEELNNLTGHFNIFNALKLQNNEIRHSNFLSWIMAPYESHKLGAYFLKEFLKSAIKEYSLNDKVKLGLKDIIFFNLDDVEIRREYKNIDLLIISPQNKFLCIVENKIWTGEHDCQLERYAAIVEKEFKDYKQKYIYLAPNIECKELLYRAKDKVTQAYYIPMSYEQVHKAIDKTLRFRADNMSDDVRIFIEHYKKMVERNIMGNTDKEIVELCRRIYRENKEAIDLITSYSNITGEIIEHIQEIYADELFSLNKDGMFVIKSLKNLQNGNSKYGEDLVLLQLEKGAKYYSFCINIVPAKNNTETQRKEVINKIEKGLNISLKNNDKENVWCYYNVPLITEDEYYSFSTSEQIQEFLKAKIDETGFIKFFSNNF